MSIDRRAEQRGEARQARCVENHCEIHAPLNPEWPLSKLWAGGGGLGEEGSQWGHLSSPRITRQSPDTLLEERESEIEWFKQSGGLSVTALWDGVKMLSAGVKWQRVAPGHSLMSEAGISD